MDTAPPDWLSPLAIDLWERLQPELALDTKHLTTFAVLCQTYSDYRTAKDFRSKKCYLDYYLKMSKEFGLTTRAARLNPKSTDVSTEAILDS